MKKNNFTKLHYKIINFAFKKELKKIYQIKKEIGSLKELVQWQSQLLSDLSPNQPETKSSLQGSKPVFIIGSGMSLLDLDKQEKNRLRDSYTIAMNKYLMFWEIINIWPKAVFLADHHYPAPLVLRKSLEISRDNNQNEPPVFLLNQCYQSWPCIHPAVFFDREPGMVGKSAWAENLEEPMLNFRGSLVTLLNLLYVLEVKGPVILLGIDLNRKESFYDQEIKKYPELFDRFMKADTKMHATAEAIDGYPSIVEKLPWVFQKLHEKGIECFNFSSTGLLAEENILPVWQNTDSYTEWLQIS